MRKLSYIALIFVLMSSSPAFSQETVFALLKSDKKRADQYFREKNYESALLYYSSASRRRFNSTLALQIAESSFHLKKYKQAVQAYEEYLKSNSTPPQSSLFQLAESYASLGDYTNAVRYYREYLAKHGDDPIVLKKIWRINNLKFLYEDSAHFAVRSVSLNSSEGDINIQPYQNGFLFLSNRKELRVVEKLDASTSKPFFKMYYSRTVADSTVSGMRFGKAARFTKTAGFKFHVGPFAFYLHQTRMVVTKLGKQSGLVFAERKGNDWVVRSEFPFNSNKYSITDPSMNEAGTVLYFSSDMPGGFGGKDIYRSTLINGQWSKPVNLGDLINTPYNEVSPHLHRNNTLYFSSDGQPGIGGLDIFKADILVDGFEEPKNIGYPLNSKLDDFGVTLDSTGRKGFFASNRNGGGFNDDLYEFEMDLQPYPLVIKGTLRYKEHSWNDSSALTNFGRAKLYVIDAIKNVVVFEQTTDEHGKFAINIPHFSMYKIRVIGEDQHENIVSLALPKYLEEQSDHDIVVVKDAFRNPDSNQKEK